MNTQSQPNSDPMPYAYGYQYHDCVRFNDGREVNGARPVKAIPLYDETAIASLKARIEELEEALKKVEYALRKDSLIDSERISSAKSIVDRFLQPKESAK